MIGFGAIFCNSSAGNAPAADGRSSAELKTYITDRKGHDRRYAIDESKIRGELGYEPARAFPQGFSQTLNWYLAREDWWKPLIKRSPTKFGG